MNARLRPMRSPTLLPMRMNAADTSASRAIAPWTPLTVVSRSSTTLAIDTFINDVSTTRTNIAIASMTASRRVWPVHVGSSPFVPIRAPWRAAPVGSQSEPGEAVGSSPMELHHHTAQVNGVILHYVEAGAGPL